MKQYPSFLETKARAVAWTGVFLAVAMASAARDGSTVPDASRPPPPIEAANPAGASAADPQKRPPVAPNSEGDKMNPYVVSEPIYKAYIAPFEKYRIDLFWKMIIDFEFGGSGRNLRSSSVITPLRAPQRRSDTAFTVHVLEGKELRSGPSVSPDEALSSEAEFSLSGRSGGPSARWYGRDVALRGVGSGSFSTRVLLDGVPFNDPFGGWVPWTETPREGLARVETVPGGGATAWGNGALGGVVQLFTLPPSGELVIRPGSPLGGGPVDPDLTKPVVVGIGQIAAEFGAFDTRGFEFVDAQPTNEGVLQVLGNVFSTDGYPLVSPLQRGPIDIAAWSRHDWFEARWRQLLGEKLVVTATLRSHEESYGEGTPYQQGRSNGKFASLAVAGQPSTGYAWNGIVYVQDGGAANTFGSVNAARTAETPVLDQFAVPETAFGASWNGMWRQSDGSSSSAGADFRFLRGETRDDYSFADGAFTRELDAGGEQDDFGAFFLRDQSLASTLRVTFGARIDIWNEAAGHQSENSILSGTVLSDRFSTESGTEFSPSIGLVWRAITNLKLHVNGQQSFSRPTLGELYQPFGQDAIVTEANPMLRTEHNTSFEAGAEYSLRLNPASRDASANPSASPPNHPSETVTFGATAFCNELHDAIGNLTLAHEPGGLPFFGSLPEGYLGEQRINLDRSRIQGVALSAAWYLGSSFSMEANVLFSDAIISRVTSAPEIAGKQIAGVSRRSAAISATWHVSGKIALRSRLRLLGPQFEDDENTLRLGEAVVVDLGASFALTKHTALFLSAENLADARVETSRSADGVVYMGSPRMVRGGVRLSW